MSDLEKLSVERSTAVIMDAAQKGRYLSYSEVAAANGLEWSFELSRNINKLLNEVLCRAHAGGLPLITSIVVNKPNLKTGALNANALRGFVKCAVGLGYEVDAANAEGFLADQQRETFACALAHNGEGAQ